MKTASAPLIAHLTNTQEFRRAELWTFTLVGGQVTRYTTLDQDVTIAATTWPKNGPVLTRPRSKLVAGIAVDEFEITVQPKSTDLIGGFPWPQAARLGLLRHGRVLIERVYFPSWGDVSLGKLFVMGGRMAGIPLAHGAQVTIKVRSDLELLNVNIPIDVVQPTCRHTLFDAGCTLAAAAFKVGGVATQAGSTVSAVNATLGQADGYFSLGRIVYTSGPNAGYSRSIKKHAAGAPAVLTLVTPLPAAPVPGDAFDLYPGCNKLQATCSGTFANLPNFGGETYVPRPETVL